MGQGRMINTDISLSANVSNLSPEAMALFCLLIPHFNNHGKMLANPHAIKGIVCPLVDWLTVERIEECLSEISEKTNVKWWQNEKGLHYLQSLNWSEHQKLRPDRLGTDKLPDYPGGAQIKSASNGSTPGVLPEYSGEYPGALHSEVEIEVEVEGEEEAKKEASSDSLRLSGLLAELIAGNNPQNKNIQPKKRKKSIERWAADVDRMLRLDGRDPHELEEVIRWSQENEFWRGNILSGSKLRQQFDQLIVQMQRDRQKGRPPGEVIALGRRCY